MKVIGIGIILKGPQFKYDRNLNGQSANCGHLKWRHDSNDDGLNFTVKGGRESNEAHQLRSYSMYGPYSETIYATNAIVG